MARKPTPVEEDDAPRPEAEGEAAATAKPARAIGLGFILALLGMTAMALGAGGGLGYVLYAQVQKAVVARTLVETKATRAEVKYPGNLVVEKLEPVVTNLADPSNVWIRLELVMIFPNGALPNPAVAASEIRQDVVAYARTIQLSQLETPSALQHLREDLNERAVLRTGGKVRELAVVSMVVQ
jgi:flagellar FliL protein